MSKGILELIHILFFVFGYFYLLISRKKDSKSSLIVGLFITVPILLSFGLRDFSVGTDTSLYLRIYDSLIDNQITFNFIGEYGIYFLFKLISLLGFPNFIALLIVSAINILLMVRISKYLSGFNILIYFLISLSSFAFIDSQINLMKFGIASNLIILSYYSKRKKLLYLFLAINFHLSMLFLLIAYVFSKKIKLSIIYKIYISSLLFSFVLFKSQLFIKMTSFILNILDLNVFITRISSVGIKFQYSMVIYSTLLVFTGYLFHLKTELFKIFILLSSFFVLINFIPYSYRVGYLSWILIPIVFSNYGDISRKKIIVFTTINFIVSVFFVKSFN